MKPKPEQVQDLRDRLVAQRQAAGVTLAEIGYEAGVHPSQVGRILQGQFRTFSFNVMRVCEALNVPIGNEAGAPPDANLQRAERSVRRMLEGNPENAKTVSRLLESVANLQSN